MKKQKIKNKQTKKEKSVQIEYNLFFDCFMCICVGTEDPEIWKRASEGLEKKFGKMVNRELYTTYLTAKTPEEREKARQEYLDRIGIPPSFRWTSNSDIKDFA